MWVEMWDIHRRILKMTHYFNDIVTSIGAPGGTRTPDTQVRSLVLYPTELRARGRAARGAQPKHPAQVYTRLQGPDTDG